MQSHNQLSIYYYNNQVLQSQEQDKSAQILMDWRKVNFCSYCTAFIFYGAMITAMGPVIPFFSAQTGRAETYYSFIFLWRAVGYVVGGFAVKYLVQKFSLHCILTCAGIIGGLSFMASTFSLTFWNLSITIFLGAACCIIINVICNICIMKIFPGEGEQGFYIQLLHTIFGVGGLLGPFIVSELGSKSYFVLGIILAVVSISFLFVSSPDGGEAGRVSVIAKPINRRSQTLICLLYMLYIGQQVGYGSWVSSFAVMQKVADLRQAAYASQVFWVTNTAFRIVLLYVTFSVTLRLKLLLGGMVVGCIINYAAACFGYEWFAAFIGSFLNGMFLASMFALFLQLPSQYGYRLSKQNTANFMMCASMGEGVLSMPIGYAMGIFGPDTLYLLQLIFAIISYILFMDVISIFKSQTQQLLNAKQVEMQVSSLKILQPHDNI